MKENSNVLTGDARLGGHSGNGLKEGSLDEISRNIIANHLGSFTENDLDGVISDYIDESVLITQTATYKGPEEIRGFFAELIPHFPKGKSSFELDNLEVHGEFVYIVWHANTPSLQVPLGSDTFNIKNGKILQQTFVGQLNFLNQ